MALSPVPRPERLIIDASESWATVLNDDQSLLGRCFCLLKRPETDPAALSDDELSELWQAVRSIKKALDTLFSPDHYNYAFLMNVDPQVHFHVIPRYENRREFADETFLDARFGGHYPIDRPRTLEEPTYRALIEAMRSAVSL